MNTFYRLRKVFPFKSEWVLKTKDVSLPRVYAMERLLFEQFCHWGGFVDIVYDAKLSGFVITIRGWVSEKRMRRYMVDMMDDIIPVDVCDLIRTGNAAENAKAVTDELYRIKNCIIKGE